MMTIKLRFAPSPTGYVHIGSLRTALYNYLYAKKNNGSYVLRIEDTDQTRFVEGALENLLDSLHWAGLEHDEGVMMDDQGQIVQKGDNGPYIQSERLDIYHEYVKGLLQQKHAYPCFCSKERLESIREQQKIEGKTPMYDRHCLSLTEEESSERIKAGEPHVIRLKIPQDKDMVFNDLVRGEVIIHSSEIDDQVLIKSDGFPTYHFAVVIDDHLMGITHIVRGEEWLTSTPKQVALYQYFKWDVPQFVHLPTVLNKDKKKLSKRQGDVSVGDFRQKGYLPEALINYLALIGWSPLENKEIFDLQELVEAFSFDRVSKTGGVFDLEKLNWMNNQYIKKTDSRRLLHLCVPYILATGLDNEANIEKNPSWYLAILDLIKEKIDYLSQIQDYLSLFYGDEVSLDNEEVVEVLQQEHVKRLLNSFSTKLVEADTIDETFTSEIFNILKQETGAKGKGLFMPIRAAVTGELHGSDLGKIFQILGKDKMIKRINYVLETLND